MKTAINPSIGSRPLYPYIFQSGSPDFVLRGSRRPIQTDWRAANLRFEEPTVRENLKSLGVDNLLQLLFAPNMPALRLLSAISPEHAKLWLNKSEEWSQLKLPADIHKNILQFRVDLCLATGDLKSAETLLNELIHDADPPPFLWSILRTSEIDRVRLRLEILSAYRRPQDLPTVLQFMTLTASR